MINEKSLAELRDLIDGVGRNLVEEIMRRVMRDSYSAKVVVGGGGALRSLFVRILASSGYEVRILEKGDWSRAASIVQDAALYTQIIFSHTMLQQATDKRIP